MIKIARTQCSCVFAINLESSRIDKGRLDKFIYNQVVLLYQFRFLLGIKSLFFPNVTFPAPFLPLFQ